MSIKKLADDDSKVVLNFLEKMDGESPFSEHESYYSRSSHSDHDNMFERMHRGDMKKVFSVATDENDSLLVDSETYRTVASDLEKLFIIGHALSAVHDELNNTDGIVTGFFGSGHPRWFHGPFPGGWVTFSDKWDNDFRVPIGYVVKTSAELKVDPLVVQAYESYERVITEFYPKVYKRDGEQLVSVPEATLDFKVELANLHEILKNVLKQLAARIKGHC